MTPANLLGAAGIGVGLSQVVSFLGDATNAAAEFQDSVGATGVIFGEEMVPQMEAWGEAAAQNFGASKQEALAAANVIATLGKSAGLAGEDLVDFSQEMVGLGGDLASMFGGTTQDAITAVGAALRGESEPIRRYGVLLDDATLRQKAFEMGITDTISNALTPQQRVLAAQASIMEQTADAQGDFVRTSDGMANTQRELAAELANVNIEIGEKLMPAMLAFATFVKDVGVPAINGLVGATDGIGQAAEGVARFLDTVSFTSGDVQRAAEAMGISYMEARDLIKLANQESGQSAADFADDAEASAASIERSADAVSESMTEGMRATHQAMADAAPLIEETGRIIADIPRKTMVEAYQGMRKAAYQAQVEIAKGLIEGQNEPQVAMDAALQLVEEELTAEQEIMRLKGNLLTLETAKGIASEEGKTASVIAINGAIQATKDRLDYVRSDFYTSGYNIGVAWANGLRGASDYAALRAWELAASTKPNLRGLSPPKEGPLKDIDKWGTNVGLAWADGLLGAAGVAGANGRQLAGAVAQSLSPRVPGLAGGMAGGGVSGPTTNFILQVSGKEDEVGTRDDILDRWDEMAHFGGSG